MTNSKCMSVGTINFYKNGILAGEYSVPFDQSDVGGNEQLKWIAEEYSGMVPEDITLENRIRVFITFLARDIIKCFELVDSPAPNVRASSLNLSTRFAACIARLTGLESWVMEFDELDNRGVRVSWRGI